MVAGPSIFPGKVLALIAVIALCSTAQAQSGTSLPDAPTPQRTVTLRTAPAHILHDQAAIWTSPARLRPHDLIWLAPLAAAEGAALATDHHTMSTVVSRNSSFNQNNANVSNVLIGSYIALPVALYSYGHFDQDSHAREAGILGSESVIDGVVVEQGLKLVFWRERPALDNARGRFWQSSAGVDSSFPSSHCIIAWSAASSLAGEYNRPWQQVSLYTAASAISLTRVLGEQHFPGDVLAGSAVGWLVGHYVFRAHHRLLHRRR